MKGKYLGELPQEGDSKQFIDTLKRIGRERIYCTESTLKLELMGRKIIQDLMDTFWEGAQSLPRDGSFRANTFPGRAMALLSDNYKKVFTHCVDTGLNETYCRYLLVTDYVCGMTDSFAKRLHSELRNG
jgi:dGTPase